MLALSQHQVCSRVGGAARLPPPLLTNQNLKRKPFCRHNDINALLGSPFSQNQLLKFADDSCVGLLNNEIKEELEDVCTFFLFRLLLIFSVIQLAVSWEVVKWDYVMLHYCYIYDTEQFL
jgi:hypothetical protein